jgi:hypothetical protein
MMEEAITEERKKTREEIKEEAIVKLMSECEYKREDAEGLIRMHVEKEKEKEERTKAEKILREMWKALKEIK